MSSLPCLYVHEACCYLKTIGQYAVKQSMGLLCKKCWELETLRCDQGSWRPCSNCL